MSVNNITGQRRREEGVGGRHRRDGLADARLNERLPRVEEGGALARAVLVLQYVARKQQRVACSRRANGNCA